MRKSFSLFPLRPTRAANTSRARARSCGQITIQGLEDTMITQPETLSCVSAPMFFRRFMCAQQRQAVLWVSQYTSMHSTTRVWNQAALGAEALSGRRGRASAPLCGYPSVFLDTSDNMSLEPRSSGRRDPTSASSRFLPLTLPLFPGPNSSRACVQEFEREKSCRGLTR